MRRRRRYSRKSRRNGGREDSDVLWNIFAIFLGLFIWIGDYESKKSEERSQRERYGRVRRNITYNRHNNLSTNTANNTKIDNKSNKNKESSIRKNKENNSDNNIVDRTNKDSISATNNDIDFNKHINNAYNTSSKTYNSTSSNYYHPASRTTPIRIPDDRKTVEDVKEASNKTDVKYFETSKKAIKEKKIHCATARIMVEAIKDSYVRQCPAVVWVEEGMLKVLPLIEKSKEYSWELDSIDKIMYQNRRNPDVDEEYSHLVGKDILDEYEELLPKYPFDREGIYTWKVILEGGLEVTNSSAEELLTLIEDKHTDAKEWKEWFNKPENGTVIDEQVRLLIDNADEFLFYSML